MTDNKAVAPSKSGSYATAAQRAQDHRTITINFEGLGSMRLPPKEELAFLAGMGLLAAAGIIDWPVAGILAVGHLIARNSRNRAFKEFGEALEEA